MPNFTRSFLPEILYILVHIFFKNKLPFNKLFVFFVPLIFVILFLYFAITHAEERAIYLLRTCCRVANVVSCLLNIAP